MGLSLKPGHLKRYRDIAALFLKYGRSDLLLETQPDKESSAAIALAPAGRRGAVFAERLPGRVNRVLDAFVNQDLKLRVEMIDEGSVLEGLQKIANRITLGLLLAAMIIGAAMLMRMDSALRIFGYPAIAMFFFIAAAAGAGLLALTIVRGDRRRVSASRHAANRAARR